MGGVYHDVGGFGSRCMDRSAEDGRLVGCNCCLLFWQGQNNDHVVGCLLSKKTSILWSKVNGADGGDGGSIFSVT